MQITIKAARVNKGLSQQQVADHMKLSLRAYQRKENGHSKFYADEIVLFSRLVDVPVENFFDIMCRKKTQSTA